MLTAAELKPFLTHEDRFVRERAIRYFADSWSRDPSVASAILRSVETYGETESVEGLRALNRLPLDEPDFLAILDRLGRTEDEPARYHLNQAIATASLNHVTKF